jgi:hypothetical protein
VSVKIVGITPKVYCHISKTVHFEYSPLGRIRHDTKNDLLYPYPRIFLFLQDSVFTSDMFPMLPPFLVGKAISGYRGKAAVPMETAFPPVFYMAGAFDGRLGDLLPLRGVRITVQQPVMKTPDDPVFGYPDSLKGFAPGIPAYIVRLVRFDMVRLG